MSVLAGDPFTMTPASKDIIRLGGGSLGPTIRPRTPLGPSVDCFYLQRDPFFVRVFLGRRTPIRDLPPEFPKSSDFGDIICPGGGSSPRLPRP